MSKVKIGQSEAFKEGKHEVVDAQGTSLVVARINGKLCAVQNRCAHLPLPLGGGKLVDGAIQCPFHGSQFDMCTGENRDWVRGVAGVKLPKWSRSLIALGSKPRNISSYVVTEEDGEVFVEVTG